MIQSQVHIQDLYQINDEEMMQMILSSGDYFPGFYRYTLGTQKVGDESLGLSTLVWLSFEQQMTKHKHHKEEWLELQHEIHDRDVASDSARNARNFPEVRSMFADAMMDWYFEALGFDIAYLDVFTKVSEFEANKTYYFMGSLIRYEEGRFKVSYNAVTKQSALELKVSFEQVASYIKEAFTAQQLSDLFLEAEIIAELKFDPEKTGELQMADLNVDELLVKHPEIKVFGAPIESRDLPMRYAKCIRLTNFRRGNEGKFEVWKSDQNW